MMAGCAGSAGRDAWVAEAVGANAGEHLAQNSGWSSARELVTMQRNGEAQRSLAYRQPKSRLKMATQIVMDHTGDTRHQFDPADAAAVGEAEKRFKELIGYGFTAAKRLDDGKSELVKNFDPTAEETLFIPRLEGG
jgi:hypothetical protein